MFPALFTSLSVPGRTGTARLKWHCSRGGIPWNPSDRAMLKNWAW